MIAQLLLELTQERLCSVHDIARITERGESTVYRWINGESNPDYLSIRKLIIGIENQEAQRRLLDHFCGALPVAVAWVDAGDPQRDRLSTLKVCMQAISEVADAVSRVIDESEDADLAQEHVRHAEKLIGHAVTELAGCRMHLNRSGPSSNGENN